MTNSKKRLTEILKDLCYNTIGNPPYRIDQAITEILKEFIYKDNFRILKEYEKDITDIQDTILSHLERIEFLEKELKKANWKIWVLKGSEQSWSDLWIKERESWLIYKDNLLKFIKDFDKPCPDIACSSDGYLCVHLKGKLIKAIRKLIEGDQSV